MGSASPEPGDPSIARLRSLFREHPAWVQAARHTADGASSKVFFSHRPGEAWHLVRVGGESLLRPGPATSPDFAFRFTPAAIDRLASVEGDVGDFAVALFSLILEKDERLRIGFRAIASFPRLVRRGYLRLLLSAGPRVVGFGARHGVSGLGELRRMLAQLRARPPEAWELEAE